MPEVIKDQRKVLKTTITNAISVALSKNKHLKDKKIQKAIKKAASELAKKITKVGEVKIPSVPVAKKSTKKVVVSALKKPTVKRVVKLK